MNYRAMERVTLSVADLRKYIPAHIIIAEDHRILAMGPALEKNFQQKWQGRKLGVFFTISRDSFAQSIDQTECRKPITLESKEGGARYSGYVWQSDNEKLLLLSCASSSTAWSDFPLVPSNVEATLLSELQAVLLAEMQAIVTEAVASKTRADNLAESAALLSSLMSHDLNNYLSVVNMCLSRLNDIQDSKFSNYISQARSASHLATSMVKSMLDISGHALTAIPAFQLDDLILEMEDFFRSLLPDRVNLVCALAAPGTDVAVSRQYLIRVLTNLIKNAGEELSGSGGNVFLTTRVDGGDLTRARVSVRNSGAFLPPHLLTKIESGIPFSTKMGGHGLGLKSVRDICQKLGWEFTLSAGEEGGLCADVVLSVRTPALKIAASTV